MDIKGKKVLLIAPNFHALQEKIEAEIEALGAKVYYFDERPSNTFFTKFCIRMGWHWLVRRKISNYYTSIVEKTKNQKIDVVLIVNLEAMPHSAIKKLAEQQKEASFFLYMWDSMRLKPVSASTIGLFDKVFTFDPQDAETYNLHFLPLFYSKEYQDKAGEQSDIKYDLLFIGTVHGQRYTQLEAIKKQAEKLGLRVFFYYYMPSRTLYFIRKIIDRDFRKLKYAEVQFQSLSANDIVKLMRSSRAVVDLSHKIQVGLSMRTFEALGMRKKLLTTNKEVVNYDFYDPANIKLIKPENINLDSDFFKADYVEIKTAIYAKYSLNFWVKSIFGSNNSE